MTRSGSPGGREITGRESGGSPDRNAGEEQ
jgi:hypothetical protein